MSAAHGADAMARALPADPRTLGSRLSGTPLLVLLDVDGTLAPIAPRPEDAVVPEATRDAIAALVRARGVHVALVSGRAAHDARRMVGVHGVWAIGNHGFDTIAPDGVAMVDPRVATWVRALHEARESAGVVSAAVPGAHVEDKGATLSVHYRAVAPGDVARLEAEILSVAAGAGLRLTRGRKVIELRPPIDVDKGTASVALAQQLGALAGSASLLFAGDDTTDEDAMTALRESHPGAVTINVKGEEPRATRAEFKVASTGELGKWLAALAAMRGGGE